jgi:TPR repeat protein
VRRTEQSGDADRWLSEGFAHEDGGRIRQAVSAYRKAARRGDPIAQSNLANLLDDKIKPARPKEAVQWYKRAIRAGSSIAAFNLAVHYRNKGSARWSRHWFEVAAKMGDPDARAELRKISR